MDNNARIYWLHATSPLHVGSGSGMGYIDQPIMREKVTNWPLVPGSALKGVISDIHSAEACRNKETNNLGDKEKKILCAFGRAGNDHSNSGSLVFTDSRIVCLPIRSFHGTFAWCTSSLALQRLARDLMFISAGNPAAPACPADTEAWIPDSDSKLQGPDSKILLEDLALDSNQNNNVSDWAKWLAKQVFPGQNDWQTVFQQRFTVLSDNVFDFLCETGTEVNARIRIDDDKKTAASGALWYEESLPAETILSGLIWCDRIFGKENSLKPKDLLDTFCTDSIEDLQIGGNATIGRGRVRCLFTMGGQL